MNDWATIELGKIVKSGGGKIHTGPFGSQLHASDYVSVGIPCIMPVNMIDSRIDLSSISYITESDAQRLSKYLVKGGDIVYSRRGDVTQKALIRDDETGYFCGTGCLLLRPGSKINSEFLVYYLSTNTMKKWIKQQAVGATMPNLNTGILARIPFKAPNKIKQIKVSKVISSIDKKIEINKKINTELEAMAELIYDYWFVQFDFPDEHGKPYKSSGGKMLYNEELKREIPDGWVVEGLTKAMEVQYGFPFSTKLFNEEKAGLPVVRIRNLLDTSITMYSTESVDQKYLIKKGDLLVGMDGNFHMNFWDKEGCYLNQRCVRIRSRADSTVTNFQAFFQISPYIKAREKNVSRTTVGHLSAKDIDDLYVLIPCSNNLLCKTSYFDSMLEKIITHRNESQKLAELRDWLLPMLMNGQVTVD